MRGQEKEGRETWKKRERKKLGFAKSSITLTGGKERIHWGRSLMTLGEKNPSQTRGKILKNTDTVASLKPQSSERERKNYSNRSRRIFPAPGVIGKKQKKEEWRRPKVELRSGIEKKLKIQKKNEIIKID